MKHAQLRAIAHNIADSLASGCSLVLGIYDLDFFREINASPNRRITIDLLNGIVIEGSVSKKLKNAVASCPVALRAMCANEQVMIYDYRQIHGEFSFSRNKIYLNLTIEDRRKKKTTAEYYGTPLKRLRQLDHHGRIRAKPVRKHQRESD